MTKQTNKKPQSLDEYFARAKATNNGMSSKQVSELISAAPAAKLSWLAYLKPLASKINSVLLISALAVVAFLAVDLDDDVQSVIQKENTAEIMQDKDNTAEKAAEPINKVSAMKVKEENFSAQIMKKASSKSNYKTSSFSNKIETEIASESLESEDANLWANNKSITPSSIVVVQNEYTLHQTIEFIPYAVENTSKNEEPELEEAEETIETFQTLAGKNAKNMYYLQFDTKFTNTSLDRALLLGGRIAWMPSEYMSFGFSGYGMTDKPIIKMVMTDETLGTEEIVDGNLYAGYGGFFMEYYIFPKEVIHGYVGGFFGLGGVHAAPVNGNTKDKQSQNVSVIWLVEPNAGIELNVTNFLKLGFDVSYRYSEVSGLDKLYAQSPDLTNFNFSGLSTSVYFKLGLY